MNISYVVCLLFAALLGACGMGKDQKGTELIRDCPEEKIVNKMPIVVEEGGSSEPTSYFIYKGERRELKDLDIEWLKANCDVKETEVQ